MRKLTVVIALSILMFNIAACNDHPAEKAVNRKEIKKKGKYFCTMHPLETFDKPGTCPKCGMELVERDTIDDK